MAAGAGPEGSRLRADDFERLSRQLSRAIARACPHWLAQHRQDLEQAAMVRLLEQQALREQGDPPPPSYVWKVAYAVTVDEMRRIRRRREASLAELESRSPVPARGSDPYDARFHRELGDAVLECLARLPEARRLVVGFHLLGHPLREIPALVGQSFNRTRNLLYRGLAELRDCVSAKGFAP